MIAPMTPEQPTDWQRRANLWQERSAKATERALKAEAEVERLRAQVADAWDQGGNARQEHLWRVKLKQASPGERPPNPYRTSLTSGDGVPS